MLKQGAQHKDQPLKIELVANPLSKTRTSLKRHIADWEVGEDTKSVDITGLFVNFQTEVTTEYQPRRKVFPRGLFML